MGSDFRRLGWDEGEPDPLLRELARESGGSGIEPFLLSQSVTPPITQPISFVNLGGAWSDTAGVFIDLNNVSVPGGAMLICMYANSNNSIFGGLTIDLGGTLLNLDSNDGALSANVGGGFFSRFFPSAVINARLRLTQTDLQATHIGFWALYARSITGADQSNRGTGTSTGSDTGPITPTKNHELVLANVVTNGRNIDTLGTWGGGFNAFQRQGSGATVAVDQKMATQIIAAGGAQDASITGATSRNWVAMIQSYKGPLA
jgi:hypothetical protein